VDNSSFVIRDKDLQFLSTAVRPRFTRSRPPPIRFRPRNPRHVSVTSPAWAALNFVPPERREKPSVRVLTTFSDPAGLQLSVVYPAERALRPARAGHNMRLCLHR
jgi:hypothetical protein